MIFCLCFIDRTGSIRKCSNYASMMGYKMFAIFDGGQCLTGPDVAAQFSKSGASNKCSFNGLGSSESMNVFTFDPGNSEMIRNICF